jgi:hypothetical protein
MIDVSKIILVAGPGGSRADFTAGWIGKLPGFIDSNWNINISTGRSHGFMTFAKSLDFGNNLENILRGTSIQINSNSPFMCSGSIHRINTETFCNFVKQESIKILQIDVKNAPGGTIVWEFFVKTYLTPDNSHHGLNTKTLWGIDNHINKSLITDSDRADCVQLMMKNATENIKNKNLQELAHTTVSYNKIFQPGGSLFVAEALNLNVSQKYHDYWDAMLPFAKSPDSIVAFGRQWKKEDYFES